MPAQTFARGLHFPSRALSVDGPLPEGQDSGPRLLAPSPDAAALVVVPGGSVPFLVRWEGGAIIGVNLHCANGYHQVAVRAEMESGPSRLTIAAELDADVCANLPARCHRIEYAEQLVMPDGTYSRPRARALFLDCAGSGCGEPSGGAAPIEEPGEGSGSADDEAVAPDDALDAVLDAVLPTDCSAGETACVSERQQVSCEARGTWSEPTSCPGVCLQGRCVGECEPGRTRCGANGSSVESCELDGEWADPSPCESSCSEGSCRGECTPGSTRCFDAVEAQSCSALGQWQSERCDYVCEALTGRCGGQCAPGRRACVGNTPRECDASGNWRDGTPCPRSCSEGLCEAECEPNETRCDPDSERGRQICVGGSWVTASLCEVACADSTTASGARTGACFGECSPGQTRCEGTDVLRTCNDDYEFVDSTCSFACVSPGTCGGDCKPGRYRCGADGVNERCDDAGRWQRQAPCPTGQVCFGVLGQCTQLP